MVPDKIEVIKDETIFFIRKTGVYATATNDAWRAMRAFIEANQLLRTGLRYFGVSHDAFQINKNVEISYDAAIVACPGARGKEGIEEVVLQGGKYAVFTHKGRYTYLEKTLSSILSKWLPKSSEKFDEKRSSYCEYIDMEGMKANPSEMITKIYIPLL